MTPDPKSPEVLPEKPKMDSVPVVAVGPEGDAVEPEGGAVEPEGDKGEVAAASPKQHHILDELLTRAQQDLALGKVPGKGRRPKKDVAAAPGRGRARNKGESGRGRGRGARAAKSKASKPAACRKLPLENVDPSEDFSLTKEPESWVDSDEEMPVSNSGGEASSSRPKGKAKAKPARPEDGVAKRRGRKPRVESAGSAPKPQPKKRSAPKVKAAPKKSRKGEPTKKVEEERDEGKGSTRKRPNIPVFQTSTIVPYWSRNAIALKVHSALTKSGWTQAWF